MGIYIYDVEKNKPLIYMETVLQYLYRSSNYSLSNQNNLFNFVIDIMHNVNVEDKKFIINSMKINIGLKFYESFKWYLYKKLPKDELLTYID